MVGIDFLLQRTDTMQLLDDKKGLGTTWQSTNCKKATTLKANEEIYV